MVVTVEKTDNLASINVTRAHYQWSLNNWMHTNRLTDK